MKRNRWALPYTALFSVIFVLDVILAIDNFGDDGGWPLGVLMCVAALVMLYFVFDTLRVYFGRW